MYAIPNFREAIKLLGPDRADKSIREWLLDEKVWSKLRKKSLNSSQVSLLYFSTKLTDEQPADAVNSLQALDVTFASIFLSSVVKPCAGWNSETLKALQYMRTVKNTVYSHANKCWIDGDLYYSLETSINSHIHVILQDAVISFSDRFKSKLEDWLLKSKELMTSRDDVLKYLHGEMKHDLLKIKEDQLLLLNKTEEQTDLLRSLVEAQSSSITESEVSMWTRLREDSWRKFRNPIFNHVTLLGVLKKSALTLMDVWQEIEVKGNGWLGGQITLVCERFLTSTQREWYIEGTGASGKTCFIKKLCLQAEVFNTNKLLILIDRSTPLNIISNIHADNSSHVHLAGQKTMLLSTLIEIGLFGFFKEDEKDLVKRCILQFSDNILFLFDGIDVQNSILQIVKNSQTLARSKIIITGSSRADQLSRSTIVGLSNAGRNSLLNRCLSSLLGVENVATQLPTLRRFFDTMLQNEAKVLTRYALIIQFVCILYFTRHCNTSAIHHFFSRRDLVNDINRSFLLSKDCQSKLVFILEEYLGKKA